MYEIKTVEEFNNTINNTTKHNKDYIFVDFYASWCGSCKRFDPTLLQFNQKYNKKIHYIKVNIDILPELSNKYNIRKLPTFLTLKTNSNEEHLEYPRIIGTNSSIIESRLQQLDDIIHIDIDEEF